MDSSDEKVEKVAKVLKKKEGEDKAGEEKFSFAPGFSTPTTTTVTTKPSVLIPLILQNNISRHKSIASSVGSWRQEEILQI